MRLATQSFRRQRYGPNCVANRNGRCPQKLTCFVLSKVVDFSTWLLFSRVKKSSARPRHLLCDGFRKSSGPNFQRQEGLGAGKPSIPGLFSLFPNHHAETLKKTPWPELLVLLGKAGEQIMIDLLLDCGIFTSVSAGTGNMWQLSGRL